MCVCVWKGGAEGGAVRCQKKEKRRRDSPNSANPVIGSMVVGAARMVLLKRMAKTARIW